MRISIIAIGKKVPEWVQSGVDEYSRRLQRDYGLNFIEIASSLSGTSADQNLKVRKEGIDVRTCETEHALSAREHPIKTQSYIKTTTNKQK